MTDWFRSWHGAPTDIKWLAVARRANVAPGMVVAVVWQLLDRASQAEERGSIEGYDAEELAIFNGCEPEQVEAIVEAMEARGIVTQGRFTAWERRQPKREDNSAERVRAYRERQKAAGKQAKRSETQCNAPEQSRTDTDTEQKDTPPTPPERGGKRDKAPKQEYPPDFERFWREYPRKKRKDAALKAWNAARKRAPPEQITAGAARYAAESEGKDPQYVAHASTWLRAGGWKDEPDHEHTRTINADRIAEIVNGRDPDADNPPREHLWPALERPRDTGTG